MLYLRYCIKNRTFFQHRVFSLGASDLCPGGNGAVQPVQGCGRRGDTGERGDAGGENGAVHTHIVGILLHKLLPPGLLYIVFQLHTQIAVIPGVGKTAV